MRPLLPTALATGLLAATLLAPPTARAAAETCQGRAATVVGAPGQDGVRGTEGDDVVVTNGASGVKTLGGNDLVCVTGGPVAGRSTVIEAGAGEDVVDAAAATGPTLARLGAGSDTYTGSPHLDDVHGGDLDDRAIFVDTERDVITTGFGGDDHVVTGSDSRVPNGDVVVTASGRTSVSWLGPMAEGARLDGGGASKLGLRVGSGSVAIDAAAGTLVEDGRTLITWTGFADFDVAHDAGAPTPATLRFTGSGRDEELSLWLTHAGAGRQVVDLGAGDDTLLVGRADYVGGPRSSYAGGAGQDHVALWAGRTLDLDLATGRMTTTRAGRTVRGSLRGFDSTLFRAVDLVLEGTKRADELGFHACDATVRGRAGADTIMQNRYGDRFDGDLRCDRRSFRLFGNGGNDVLRGATGNDLLIGGPGRDTIQGDRGRDICSGEKLTSCEIKLR
jgi:Ca2+-binding RTX toxin-like protein